MIALLTRLLVLLQAGDISQAIATIVSALAGGGVETKAPPTIVDPRASCDDEIDECDPMIVEAEYDRRTALNYYYHRYRAPRGCFYME